MSTAPSPLRILFVTSKYNAPADGPYLTNDLAETWARAGHQVQVVSLEWDGLPKPEAYTDGRISVLRIGPVVVKRFGTLIERLIKWGWSSHAALRIVRQELDDARYDLVYTMAPLVNIGAPLRWGLKRTRRSYVYNPDFFPYYHNSVGLIPDGLVFHVARLAEEKLLRRFDVIGCMSPANERFVRNHFRLRSGQRTAVLHLWGETASPPPPDRAAVRLRHGLPSDRFIALFGGQLIHGRGIEDILAAAELARITDPDLLFLFVGRGRLEPLIQAYIDAGGSNVRVLPPIPRDDYLELAASCDIGINATAAHVVVPTFPTKTIDYLRARLPIAASVEAASDYGEFIEGNGIGLTAPAGQPQALLELLRKMAADPAAMQRMRDAAQPVLDRYLDVTVAAREIIAEAFRD